MPFKKNTSVPSQPIDAKQPDTDLVSTCPLCNEIGGELIVQTTDFRIILAQENTVGHDFPGFCRLIWQRHTTEFSTLSRDEQLQLMNAIHLIESTVKEVMGCDKVNLASLGNVVAHHHWHIIPRWQDDSHFPNPIWGEKLRNSDSKNLSSRNAKLDTLKKVLIQRFSEYN
jgi:diadenosine tetraphosphate (Ap4A) HIT family hydrolase